MSVRNSDPQSSHDSAAKIGGLAAKLRSRIKDIMRATGRDGVTISGTAKQIPEHKPWSISPRFAELEARGEIVRILVGRGKPTKRFPGGVPRYVTRFDVETKRNVNVYFLPEFAPAAAPNAQAELPLVHGSAKQDDPTANEPYIWWADELDLAQ